MSIFQLVLREIKHRKANFIFSIFAITLALCISIYSISLLNAFDSETTKRLETQQQETEQLLIKHNAKTKKTLTSLENDIRKTMKGLGFNVYLFSNEEPIETIKERGYSIKTLPQDYANKLADSKVVTINHLLPQLAKRVEWTEQKRRIMLIGVAGQVPMSHRQGMKPIMQPLEPGSIFLGYDLHHPLGIKVDDQVTLNGVVYKVAKTYLPKDFRDDGTAWIHLGEMQNLYNMQGQISSIKCLGCNCASADRVGVIRKELDAILPNIQIIEVGSKALVRAEARVKTSKRADTIRQQIIDQSHEKLSAIKTSRADSRQSLEQLNSYLVPLLFLITFITLSYLCILNVRQRREEIGILRALGVASPSIIKLFIIRALAIGLIASLITICLAYFIYLKTTGHAPSSNILFVIALAPPVIAIASTWLPALNATNLQPLNALRHD